MRMKGGEFETEVLNRRGYKARPIRVYREARVHMLDRLAEAVVDQQDWNPYMPETLPAYTMLAEVSTALARMQFPNFETLGLYRSLGTALDQYWNTDCFFAIKESSGYRVVVVDLTLDRFKHQNWVNGVVLRLETIYDRWMMQEFANNVASFFLSAFSNDDRTLFVDCARVNRAYTDHGIKQRLIKDVWDETHPYLRVCHEVLGPIDG